MRTCPGVFKELYRGFALYWNSDGYNVDGGRSFARTIEGARAELDRDIEASLARDRQTHAVKLDEAKSRGLWACRSGDTVTLYTPDSEPRTMTIRQYRNEVFDIEEKYNSDVVFA